ncbi:DUF1707 SHOCT-like domain-containing protein [Actinoalloteichus hymeniacidonis]|uniref:DUF1707 family protein n=1 Tax=Actinoalloteichus hymeniacidonis TaxID=340345 RepID=A0AAC9HQ35_9PSEU|nr:DUF1707 domain-containing protein [Actinoalloteichus hymeniacidonis]AOS63552.1 putative DUF1707 family protein [Actinoalloteichus hymeniacidonis]MBB5908402.1 hypothetical protein [Actinoalloteichus hymeniacidonis]
MEDEQIEIRIGDRERRSVDARLRAALDDGVLTLTEYDERTAQAWGARTRAELDVLTRDLPEPTTTENEADKKPVPPEGSQACEETKPEEGGLLSRIIGTMISGVVLAGGAFLGWQVLNSDDGAAVFGRQTIHIGADEPSVEVGALFGRLEIVVPDDVRVRTDGPFLFGRSNCEQACIGSDDADEVTVTVRGAMARVDILTQEEFASESRDQDEDE